MNSIRQQLETLHPQIDEILKISGVSGLSLGVLHHGELVHSAHFGCRNVAESTPPNDDTIH